ncbi:hypothetical protein NVP1193O_101 [Vibrio phage 1.193.O._10N.286.52.C6]|nr:hypothetical protein NVP1193O_101 [Vibrio phage 1.193.O._10N.286.52.C6]
MAGNEKVIIKIDGDVRRDVIRVVSLSSLSSQLKKPIKSFWDVDTDWEVEFNNGKIKHYPFYRVEVRVYE